MRKCSSRCFLVLITLFLSPKICAEVGTCYHTKSLYRTKYTAVRLSCTYVLTKCSTRSFYSESCPLRALWIHSLISTKHGHSLPVTSTSSSFHWQKYNGMRLLKNKNTSISSHFSGRSIVAEPTQLTQDCRITLQCLQHWSFFARVASLLFTLIHRSEWFCYSSLSYTHLRVISRDETTSYHSNSC